MDIWIVIGLITTLLLFVVHNIIMWLAPQVDQSNILHDVLKQSLEQVDQGNTTSHDVLKQSMGSLDMQKDVDKYVDKYNKVDAYTQINMLNNVDNKIKALEEQMENIDFELDDWVPVVNELKKFSMIHKNITGG